MLGCWDVEMAWSGKKCTKWQEAGPYHYNDDINKYKYHLDMLGSIIYKVQL